MASLLESVWEGVFTEGVNTPTLRLMNAAFYALFATLLALLFLTWGNVHVLALLVLSLALFFSVNWYVGTPPAKLTRRFVLELRRGQEKQD